MTIEVNRQRWLRSYRSSGSKQGLLCLPFAAGSASLYRDWPRHLPLWLDIMAVQLPLRENRWNDAPAESVYEIADAVASELEAARYRSVTIFGHSLGALAGYELARVIEARDTLHVDILAVSGAVPPGRVERRGPSLSHLPERQLLFVLESRYGKLPTEVWEDAGLREMVTRSARHDFSLLEGYLSAGEDFAQRSPIRADVISVMGADEGGDAIEAARDWSLLTSGSFVQEIVPGGHMAIRDRSDTVQLLAPLVATRMVEHDA